MIKAGNITDVAIAYVTSNGSIGYEVSEGKQSILLGAALNMADRTFHKLIDEQWLKSFTFSYIAVKYFTSTNKRETPTWKTKLLHYF